MQIATRSAVFVAPIPLRVVLAVTFLWVGLGKIVAEMPVQGEQAALLANMGLRLSPTQAVPPAPAVPEAEPPGAGTGEAAEPDEVEEPDEVGEPGVEPESDTGGGVPDEDEPAPSGEGWAHAGSGARVVGVQQTATTFTASDFPAPVMVKRVYGLALLTYQSAHPLADEHGNPGVPLWPDWAVRDKRPVYIAWGAAVSECLAGLLVLVGLLTRFGAIMIAGVMATAMWLTEIGPAIQAGDTHLGFLPGYDLWDTAAWKTFLWQFSLFGAAVALLFAGPGALALDRTAEVELDDEDDGP